MCDALDAGSGRQLWVHDPQAYLSARKNSADFFLPKQRGVTYWSDGGDERILLPTHDAYLLALDAKTGEPIDFPSHGVFVREIQWTGNPFKPDDDNNPPGMTDMEQARLVRQALARAVDRDAIVEHVLGGVGEPVHVTYFSINNANWDY